MDLQHIYIIQVSFVEVVNTELEMLCLYISIATCFILY